MRVITANLNGIRAAAKKGFFKWMLQQDADIVCVQETKAQLEHLPDATFRPSPYYSFFADAMKPGYSGVGIYSRRQPDNVIQGLGWPSCDNEGRYLEVQLGNVHVVSLYMPSGTSGEARQAVKYEFMQHFLEHLKKIKQTGHSYIICGDWNIAHKTIDLKNWKSNQKNSGFLPDERAWMDRVLNEHQWVDAFRVVNQQADQYTWWSQRSIKARDNNIGWRIDYQIISPDLREKVMDVAIYNDERFSDHAPMIVDYQL